MIAMHEELRHLPEPNWFHHGPQILDLLDQHRPKICVELGSNRGCSAIATARKIRQWGGRLTCIDQWIEGPSEVGLDVFESNIESAGVADVIRIVHATTHAAAQSWPYGLIDYLYIDAGHTYAECMADLEDWWPFLWVGGLVAGDDYDDPYGDPVKGVTKAWDVFEQRYRQTFNRTPTPGLAHASRLIWGIKR